MGRRRIRVLLGLEPRILLDLLTSTVNRQPDMEIVDRRIADPAEVLMAVAETDADVVILGLPADGREPGLCSHLLAEFPSLVIIALSAARDLGFIYHLVVSTEEIPAVSEATILAAIRKAAPEVTH